MRVVEYVLFVGEDDILVGVGSDHTDRVLERTSLAKSKQICKNVVSSRVWIEMMHATSCWNSVP